MVDVVLTTIQDTLKGGGDVTFTGFGKLSSRGAHGTGVNPNPTGEGLDPAANVPKLSAGSGPVGCPGLGFTRGFDGVPQVDPLSSFCR